MISVNEYFDGAVKSLGYSSLQGKSTVGVIQQGEYEFGTSTHETMTIVEGSMNVLLPGETNWITYTAGQSFEVAENTSFKVRTESAVSYLCKYR